MSCVIRSLRLEYADLGAQFLQLRIVYDSLRGVTRDMTRLKGADLLRELQVVTEASRAEGAVGPLAARIPVLTLDEGMRRV